MTAPALTEPEPPLLTRRDPEPVGAHCVRGGTAIRAGLDRNGNGALDDSEIDRTEYVCDPPMELLVREDPLAPGQACPSGGTAVHIGVDDNGDGALQDAEIDQTTPSCSSSDLWSGDFTAASWTDPVKVAALQGARVVVGSLALPGDGAVALPLLELVSGDLTITASGEVSLPALGTVGGDLKVQGGVTALHLDALTSVFGGIDVEAEHELSLALPALQTIGRDLRSDSSTLSSIALPRLRRLDGNLELGSLSSCGSLSFCRRDLGETCEITALTTVSLPVVDHIGGCVVVTDAPALAALDLGAHHVGGPLVIDAPALATLSLESLESVDSTGDRPFAVHLTNTAIEVLDLPLLTRVNGGLVMFSHRNLEAVRLPSLESETFVEVHVTSLWFGNNPALTSISAPKVRILAGLEIDGPNPRSSVPYQLDFANLVVVTGSLHLTGISLESLSGLDRLSDIGTLWISAVDGLKDLAGLSSLRRVGILDVLGNPALTSFDGLQQVHELAGAIIIGNPELTSTSGLQNTTQIVGTLWLLSNNKLTDLAFTRLQSIGQNLTLRLRSLTTLSGLSALQSLGSLTLDEQSNPMLPADEIAAFRARLGR